MAKKKMLAILGSPRSQSICAKMLTYAIQIAEENGWEVTQIHLYEKEIGYCKGCRTCLETHRCVIKDDIQELTDLLLACDRIVLAAPVYWANTPAIVKNMFDRLLGVAMEETTRFPKPRLRGKDYILLSACHTPSPFAWMFNQTRGLSRNVHEFFKTAGIKCRGKCFCTSSSKHTEVPTSIKKKIEAFVK